MGFHHTDDCDEEDIKMLERVAKYFVFEKQFWTDGDENEIDFIEAYLYYHKDTEIKQLNDILKFKTKLNKKIAKNLTVKYISAKN